MELNNNNIDAVVLFLQKESRQRFFPSFKLKIMYLFNLFLDRYNEINSIKLNVKSQVIIMEAMLSSIGIEDDIKMIISQIEDKRSSSEKVLKDERFIKQVLSKVQYLTGNIKLENHKVKVSIPLRRRSR